MRLGDIANPQAARYGKPLQGVRVLAAEQMQSLPWATQLMARMGADVVKVEHPVHGESGRGAMPFMTDPQGRRVGATFLRNNLNKRSVGIDLKQDKGRELFLRLAPHFDIVAENFKAGGMSAMGLGYDDVARVHPQVIYLSVSGFGNTVDTPYRDWPAYAGVAEAMSGIYEANRRPGEPPVINPAGPLGDIGTASIALIGVLAALRHRDLTGEGQYVDIAMLDSMVAFTDTVMHFWSMGGQRELERRDTGHRARPNLILDAFRASDGWFMLQVGREHQFERLAKIVGCPEWLDDERFATRSGWVEHLDDVIRPAIEGWASGKTKFEACHELAASGVAAGPCSSPEDVVHDPHVAARNMAVEVPRTDGVEEPYLVPGNPVKLSKMTEGPETRVPWVGEHTEDVLRSELGMTTDELLALRDEGVIT